MGLAESGEGVLDDELLLDGGQTAEGLVEGQRQDLAHGALDWDRLVLQLVGHVHQGQG